MHQDVMEAGRLAALLLGVATAALAVAADQADGLSGPVGRALSAAAITAPSQSKTKECQLGVFKWACRARGELVGDRGPLGNHPACDVSERPGTMPGWGCLRGP